MGIKLFKITSIATKLFFITCVYFTVILIKTQSSFAAGPAFEGYSKFILGGQHAGYVLQRYEIDSKKNQFTSIYYVFVKTPTGTTTESLVAKSDLNFEPISYQYSSLVDGKIKIVDATFKNKKMTGRIVVGNKTQTVTLKVPPNGFMSTFLNYVLLKNGLGVGKNYEFYALAEESPACVKSEPNCDPRQAGFIKGTANIQSEQKYKNIDAYKIKFNYKGIEFVGILGPNGDTLASISPLQNASSEIVATKEEAVGNFPFNIKHIKALFGNIPSGTKNLLNAPSDAAKTTETQMQPKTVELKTPSDQTNSQPKGQ